MQELWRWNGPTVPVQRDNGYNDMLYMSLSNLGRSRTVDLLVSLLAANNALICHSFEGHILCSFQIVNVFSSYHLIISHIKISSLNYALIIENSKEQAVHTSTISCKHVSAVVYYSKMILNTTDNLKMDTVLEIKPLMLITITLHIWYTLYTPEWFIGSF